mmetsp:Transcript_28011/g.90312  ORF Transcript_28011/g.90312 Transcript_28011/m.90312 type:complete len:341 (+) Transcript_28011:156-1178(+)
MSEVNGGANEVFVLREEVGVYFVVAEEGWLWSEEGEAASGLDGVAFVAVPADGAKEVVVAEEALAVLAGVVVDEDDGGVGRVAEGLEGAGEVGAAVDEDDVEGDLPGGVDGVDIIPVGVGDVFMGVVRAVLLESAEAPEVQLRLDAGDAPVQGLRRCRGVVVRAADRKRVPPAADRGDVINFPSPSSLVVVASSSVHGDIREAPRDGPCPEAGAPGLVVLRRVGPFGEGRDVFRRGAGAPLEVSLRADDVFGDGRGLVAAHLRGQQNRTAQFAEAPAVVAGHLLKDAHARMREEDTVRRLLRTEARQKFRQGRPGGGDVRRPKVLEPRTQRLVRRHGHVF